MYAKTYCAKNFWEKSKFLKNFVMDILYNCVMAEPWRKAVPSDGSISHTIPLKQWVRWVSLKDLLILCDISLLHSMG